MCVEARLRRLGLWASGLLMAGVVSATPVQVIDRALRIDALGARTPVTLPDTVEASGPQPVSASWEIAFDLDGSTAGLALYASGLIGQPRLMVNDALLVDERDPSQPPARSLGLLRTFELPPSLLRSGRNVVTLALTRPAFASLSVLRIGDRAELERMHRRKALGLAIGPALVATVIGVLGLAVLVLWLRRRLDTTSLYFSIGAILWSMHTFWTVLPQPLLAGMHRTVWWTSLYAWLVTFLALFCLRFAQRSKPAVEKVVFAGAASVPFLLYAAAAAGVLAPATDAVRLTLILAVLAALGAVAHHAWHRRRVDSALLVAAGLAGGGFGLRDWIVFRSDADNLPVPWTPYAGLPFILLVSWLLIDRFVMATRALEVVNQRLEQRVARRERELSANYERLTALERDQAALDERQRILRELHDGVGAKLFTSLSKVESGAIDTPAVADELRACLADMRLAMETLTPGTTELQAAIGNFLVRWEELFQDAGIQPEWRVDLPAHGLPIAPRHALALLRVMQEALTNVLRHARARHASLQLRVDGGELTLRVEDDGEGLPVDAWHKGRGLNAMRGRAEALGASFGITAATGGGTRVDLRLPMPGVSNGA